MALLTVCIFQVQKMYFIKESYWKKLFLCLLAFELKIYYNKISLVIL